MGKNVYAVILAGGKGERFWPASTGRRPKQLLSLVGDKPLLTAAIDRLDGLIPPEHIFVITNADIAKAAHAVSTSLPAGKVIGEPVGRDTAAAVTLGAALVKARDPDAVFCVLTADHVIGDIDIFSKTFKNAFAAAESDVLITIGMRPSYASTGFGYIETGAPVKSDNGRTEFFKVKRFVEKPDIATAESYLKSGSFYWNSGMFVWSVKSYEQALKKYCPSLFEMLNRLTPDVGSDQFEETLADIYASLDKISIDYALMEKAENIIMAKGGFEWDDVGSWAALQNHLGKDEHDNTTSGATECLDASGNVVVSEQGLVALLGVKDMVVVRTDKATLVCPKSRAQDVKRIVEQIRKKEIHNEFL